MQKFLTFLFLCCTSLFSSLSHASDNCLLTLVFQNNWPAVMGHVHINLYKLDENGRPEKAVAMNIWENLPHTFINARWAIETDKKIKRVKAFEFKGNFTELHKAWVKEHKKMEGIRKLLGYNCANCVTDILFSIFGVPRSCLSRMTLKPGLPFPVYKISILRLKKDPRFKKKSREEFLKIE